MLTEGDSRFLPDNATRANDNSNSQAPSTPQPTNTPINEAVILPTTGKGLFLAALILSMLSLL